MNPEQPDPKKGKSNNKSKREVVKSTKKIVQKKTKDTVNNGQIEDLIKQAFMRFYDKTSTKAAQNQEIRHLDSIISEYLENFILLGYDVAGQKVTVIHASTPSGKDALIEHLRTTLLNIIGAEPGSF